MAESVDALVSNTSGAIRAGSIPAPGTSRRLRADARSLLCLHPLLNPSRFATAPIRVASGKETAQWAFPTSSLRQQDRLYRPLPMVGSGVPAASTFYESLADADDAALMRLVISLKTVLNPSGGRLLG